MYFDRQLSSMLLLALASGGCWGTLRTRVDYSVEADIDVPHEVVVMSAPPPLRVEAESQPSAPLANAVWVAGHYEWRGHWEWVPGYWETGRAGYVWIAPVARETGGRIVYHAGYWARSDHRPPPVYQQPSALQVSVRPPEVRGAVVVQATPAPRGAVVVEPTPRGAVVVQPTPAPRGAVVVQPTPRGAVVVQPTPAPRGAVVVQPNPGAQPPRGAVVVQPTPSPRGAIDAQPNPGAQPPRGAVVVQPTPSPRGGVAVQPTPAPTEPAGRGRGTAAVEPPGRGVLAGTTVPGADVAQGRGTGAVAPPGQEAAPSCQLESSRAPREGIITVRSTGFGNGASIMVGGETAVIVARQGDRIRARLPGTPGGGAVSVVEGERRAACGTLTIIGR